MILTEKKTYTMTVTEVDQSPESGLNKKDVIIEYTNLELLHAVLTCALPAGRLTAGYRGKRRGELLNRIALVESALEARGDQLVKSEQTMYLDVTERGTISHYLGMIYTKMIARKLYGADCLVHLNLIVQPGEKKFVKYNGGYRADFIGYRRGEHTYSIWEPIGRSENSQAAFLNGCRQAAAIASVNGQEPERSTACMTYYERGYLTAVIREPKREGALELTFPERNYFQAYYQPLLELFADEHPEFLYGEKKDRYEIELPLPWFEEGKHGFRSLQIGVDAGLMELLTGGAYEKLQQPLREMEAGDETWYCGSDGICLRAGEERK